MRTRTSRPLTSATKPGQEQRRQATVSYTHLVPDLSKVTGVTSVEPDGPVVRCHVRGSVEPLLKALAAAGVARLLSREPSLEELFLAQYGGDGQLGDADHVAR